LKRAIIIVAVLLAIGAGGVAWFGGVERLGLKVPVSRSAPSAAKEQSAPRPVPVEVATVQVEPVTDEVEALGTLMADESVSIAPEIAGRLTKLGFREGERVRKGQTLLELDTSILVQELKQAEVDLGLARDTFERANSLVQRRRRLNWRPPRSVLRWRKPDWRRRPSPRPSTGWSVSGASAWGRTSRLGRP
jgi:membrane fusion protein (multidrug efflux system)